MSKKKLFDRSFYVNVKTKGFWRKKITSIVIGDGLNEIEIPPYGYFVIYTDKDITEPIVKLR